MRGERAALTVTLVPVWSSALGWRSICRFIPISPRHGSPWITHNTFLTITLPVMHFRLRFLWAGL